MAYLKQNEYDYRFYDFKDGWIWNVYWW
jgi:hypothetical protein